MLSYLKNTKVQITLLILVSAITWSSSLHSNFCGYDDMRLVINSEALEDNLRSGLSTFWQNYSYSFNSIWSNKLTVIFRPLEQYASVFAFKLWGAQPWYYHFFFNFLFHIANTIILFLITNRFLRTKFMAFVIALIWTVHPLHNEAINMISSGTGFLLGHFFSLLGSYLLLLDFPGHCEKQPTITQSIPSKLLRLCLTMTGSLCLFLGFLGSEMTLIIPILLSIIILNNNIKQGLRRTLLAIAALLSYLYLRLDVLVASQASSNEILERSFVLSPQIFLHHLKLFFFPLNLSIDQQHAMVLENAGSNYHLLSLAVGLSFAMAIIYAFYMKRNKIAFGLTLALLYIGPSLGIKGIYCLARERYSYLFVFGLVLALVVIFKKTFVKISHRNRILLLACLILALGSRSWLRNHDWANGKNLFEPLILQSQDIGVRQHWTYKLLKYQRNKGEIDHNLLFDFSQFITKYNLNDTQTVTRFKEPRPEHYLLDKYSHNRAKSIASALHYTANFNKKNFSSAEYLKHLRLAYIYDPEHFFNSLELLLYTKDPNLSQELLTELDKQSSRSFPKANKFLQALKQKQQWQLLKQYSSKYARLYPTIKYFHEYQYLAAIRLKDYDQAYHEAKFLNTKYYYRPIIQEFIDQYEAGKYKNQA